MTRRPRSEPMTGQEARDDERKALARVIADVSIAKGGPGFVTPTDTAEAVIAAGYRKHPEPEITDEMVERAAVAVGAVDLPHWSWGHQVKAGVAGTYLEMARKALEVALRVPVGEGEQ